MGSLGTDTPEMEQGVTGVGVRGGFQRGRAWPGLRRHLRGRMAGEEEVRQPPTTQNAAHQGAPFKGEDPQLVRAGAGETEGSSRETEDRV